MAQETLLDTPINADFKFTKETARFIAEQIKSNSLSKGNPLACCGYFHTNSYVVIVPVFFATSCVYLVHFELCKDNNSWHWAIHFETRTAHLKNLDGISHEQLRNTVSDMLDAFHLIFPVDQKLEKVKWINWQRNNGALVFNSAQPITSIDTAIKAFDEFYALIVEKMDKADISIIQSQYPRAFDAFKLLKLHTKLYACENDVLFQFAHLS